MRRSLSFFLLAMFTAACSGASGSGDNPGDETGVDPDVAVDPETGIPIDTAPPPAELVKNLSISEISLFQGSKLVLEKAGAPATGQRAKVAAGRAARVRVYVTPGDGWASRDVVGVLTITSGSGTVTTLTDTKTIERASADNAIDSTLNFDVDTGIIDLGATYSVSLRTGPGQPDGPSDGAQYPAGDGAADPFNAQDVGDTFHLVLVPFIVSGHTPDVTPETWRTALYSFYPVKDVELTLHAPVTWPSAVSANGSGWSNVLNKVLQLRQTEAMGDQYFYYGIFTPSSSFETFCAAGCVGGLAPLTTSPSDTYTRGAIGLGWPSSFGMGTMAQELAHSLGRQHAPCGGASQVDPSFPYKDGSIGVWGFNLNDKSLVSPTNKDFMGYCDPPTWTSDYTFGGILTRISYVATHPNMHVPAGAPLDFRTVEVAPDGHLTWGDHVKLTVPPLSKPHTVAYTDADGKVLQSATGFYYPYSSIAGGMLLVPEGPLDFAKMRVEKLGGVDRMLAR